MVMYNMRQVVQIVVATVFLLSCASAASITKRSAALNSIQGPLCKRDLLIILDTSYSVGKQNFDKQVKPFLKALVQDDDLNVRVDGTHVALMVFSEYSDRTKPGYRWQSDRTKMLINFSDGYNGKGLANYIDNIEWEDVRGGSTRTDIALQIANEQIFPLANPLNHRRSSNDLIILITDGKPHGIRSAIDVAINNAEKLKKKGVKIVGVGVGRKIKHKKFWRVLQTIASPGQAIRKRFNDLQSVRKWLKKTSCGIAASRCSCPETRAAPYYLKPNETSTEVAWIPPKPFCRGHYELFILKTTVEPALMSPQRFGNGEHKIIYKYFMENGPEIQCSIQFDVKACSCPSLNVPPVQVKPGRSTAEVQWIVPAPSCLNNNMAVEKKHLSIGSHAIDYKYQLDNSLNMTCTVTVEVKGSLCSNTPFSKQDQVCCYGVIHDKKPNSECCGQQYYDIAKKKCCPGLNTRDKEESCPVAH